MRVCALTSVLTARTPGHAQRWIKYLTAWNLILCVLLALIAHLKKIRPYTPNPHTQPCLSVWATVCPGDSKTEWQVQAAPWHPQTLPPASTLHTAHCTLLHTSLFTPPCCHHSRAVYPGCTQSAVSLNPRLKQVELAFENWNCQADAATATR